MTTETSHTTACILCECNCGIKIELDGRRFKTIRGDKEHPASQGYTCEKAMRLDHYQNGTHRLTSPLRRRSDGSYEEIDWDTAISEIAARLGQIRDTVGGDKIFFYGGAGQGNHLGRAYGAALQAAIGSKYYSNALAQEKTGEMWVDGKLYGGHTKGDFEHSDVVVFIGKNPWQSHSFPRARPVLKAMAADPKRTMIVIDPRRTETADLADIHLQVRPGTDAWCLAAMGAVLVQEDLVDHAFLAEHAVDTEPVLAALAQIPVAEYAQTCGVSEDLIRAAARAIGNAETACTYEDLGIQQAPHSTLSSYLNKLLWILTGNFGKPGTMSLHSSFVAIAGGGSGGGPRKAPSRLDSVIASVGAVATRFVADVVTAGIATAAEYSATAGLADRGAGALLSKAPITKVAAGGGVGGGGGRTTPVTGARIIGGLVPCNSIADEILTDHPDRFRAMWIDSVNPAHSLAESTRFRAALDALDLVVVIDVAFTETARHADYVLPASTQFEKCEATFFNFEFPRNVFQLRAPVLDPLPGTLAEPEIYARVIRALDVIPPATISRLRKAAHAGPDAFALAFFASVAADPSLMKLASAVLYETLGETLPPEMRGAAALWGAAQLCAAANPAGVRRAGFGGTGTQPGTKLFDAILNSRSGVTFTVDDWSDAWSYVRGREHRIKVAIPELLTELAKLDAEQLWTSEEFPFILAAGERRAFTANTIIRDSGWRRRDAAGALRMSTADAESMGFTTGSRVRVITEAGAAETVVEVSDTLRAGHITLPNGLGVDNIGTDGGAVAVGIAPNELTSSKHKDPIAGTPWHKHVPARVEAVL